MSNYIQHLEELSNEKTFERKKDYIDYNLKSIFEGVSFKKLYVLEIGPGLGELESYLNDKGGFEIDILDNDRSVLNYVSNKYKVRNKFLTSDILKLKSKLKDYDLIYMMQVLEHIPVSKSVEVVKVLFSHLKKNGCLVIVVPNANNPLGLIERYADLQHTTSFTQQSLKDLASLCGFNNNQLKISGFEIPPYGLVNIIRIILQKILHTFLLLIMIINGGTFFKTMTPNIMLVIKK